MTERIELTEKYILENSMWPPEITKQILENQKLANRWKIFNTIFTEKIDWHNIEFVAIKQNGKDMITARMG